VIAGGSGAAVFFLPPPPMPFLPPLPVELRLIADPDEIVERLEEKLFSEVTQVTEVRFWSEADRLGVEVR
jgi:hypothetical protein